jgi:Flp pilus assembly protein protease CpaA
MMFALYAGTFIGGALIVTALAIRSHKKKIWKWTECGKLFARA